MLIPMVVFNEEKTAYSLKTLNKRSDFLIINQIKVGRALCHVHMDQGGHRVIHQEAAALYFVV